MAAARIEHIKTCWCKLYMSASEMLYHTELGCFFISDSSLTLWDKSIGHTLLGGGYLFEMMHYLPEALHPAATHCMIQRVLSKML